MKELAGSTDTATDQIAATIRQIEGDTSHAVEAISRIVATIDQIAGLQDFIQAAVLEQTAVARNISAAAAGASDRATTIAGIIQRIVAEASPSPTDRTDTAHLPPWPAAQDRWSSSQRVRAG